MSKLLRGLLIGLLVLAVHSRLTQAVKEIFGFTNFVADSVYKKYDFSKISSLVFLDGNIDDQFLQYARSKNVQTYLTKSYPGDRLGDSEYRSSWFQKLSEQITKHNVNGLHLNFHEPISRNDPKREQLTHLVKYLKQNLDNQYAKLAISVPWSPINKNDTAANGQDYDYARIVHYADYVLVNSFHINRQIFVGSEYDDEVCLAKSNQGFFDAAGGLMKWLTVNDSSTNTRKFLSEDLLNYFTDDLMNSLGDDLRNKIILVYPWFGLDYTCLARVERQRCLIKPVPFVDSNCSDQVATEVPFRDIIKKMVDNKLALFYDPHSRSTYLEFSDNTHVHQLWFDYYYDYEAEISLVENYHLPELNSSSFFNKNYFPRYNDYTFKYMFASQFNLRGMGIYRLDYLDYSGSNPDTTHMWNLVPKLN